MVEIIQRLRVELARMKFEIAVSVAAVALAYMFSISRANIEVIVFKFLIFAPSLMLVHLSRQAIFPYIDLEGVLFGTGKWKDQPAGVRSAVTTGVFAYYVVLVWALTQAV